VVQESATKKIWCKHNAKYFEACMCITLSNRITFAGSASTCGGVMNSCEVGPFDSCVVIMVPDIASAENGKGNYSNYRLKQ
jgi:hypothetical protein